MNNIAQIAPLLQICHITQLVLVRHIPMITTSNDQPTPTCAAVSTFIEQPTQDIKNSPNKTAQHTVWPQVLLQRIACEWCCIIPYSGTTCLHRVQPGWQAQHNHHAGVQLHPITLSHVSTAATVLCQCYMISHTKAHMIQQTDLALAGSTDKGWSLPLQLPLHSQTTHS